MTALAKTNEVVGMIGVCRRREFAEWNDVMHWQAIPYVLPTISTGTLLPLDHYEPDFSPVAATVCARPAYPVGRIRTRQFQLSMFRTTRHRTVQVLVICTSNLPRLLEKFLTTVDAFKPKWFHPPWVIRAGHRSWLEGPAVCLGRFPNLVKPAGISSAKAVRRAITASVSGSLRPGLLKCLTALKADQIKNLGSVIPHVTSAALFRTSVLWATTIRACFPRIHAEIVPKFLGSGTTAMVAQRLGRRAIGIDLNPDYLDLAIKRTAQKALWFANGATA